MARLILQMEGVNPGSIDLNLGVTRVGRADDNDFVIRHPSISAHHCELELGLEFVRIRDCGSTNGTFVNNQRIQSATLEPGQTLRIGDIPVLVELSTDTVSVPKFERARPPQSVDLGQGIWSCERHNGVRAQWHCPKCKGKFCSPCIHQLRLIQGRTHQLCPICSAHVEWIDYDDDSRGKSVWSRVKKFFRGDN